jgi:hypothetical protein
LTTTEQIPFRNTKSRKHLRITDSESQVGGCVLDEQDGAHRLAAQPISVLNNVEFTDPADEMAYLVGEDVPTGVDFG